MDEQMEMQIYYVCDLVSSGAGTGAGAVWAGVAAPGVQLWDAPGGSHQRQGTHLRLPGLLNVTPLMRAVREAAGPAWSGRSWGGRGASGASGAIAAQSARIRPVPPAWEPGINTPLTPPRHSAQAKAVCFCWVLISLILLLVLWEY